MTAQQSNQQKILVVEDEESLAFGLQFNLQAEGYHVVCAHDGREALNLVSVEPFDLIILDIMLPFYDGFQITEKIRASSPQLPILMLTARAKIEEKVRGLECGADDYMIKPFHLDELLARIKGMLRRKTWYQKSMHDQPTFSFGENVIDFATLDCQAGKKRFKLTPHEAMMLKYLIERENRIVSRKELLENVWDISSEVETRTVDNFIVRLRKYFEPNPKKPIYIKSVRSAGYIFSSLP
ncbi:response regulator transcription factor [candidate division KSB1 bacterium]|nr:response regulator transcription factor [candidate division KSB1 bacterium]RQW11435.1 MAG: DNA-binding response regulator [candidate division KSB1 bacterium]